MTSCPETRTHALTPCLLLALMVAPASCARTNLDGEVANHVTDDGMADGKSPPSSLEPTAGSSAAAAGQTGASSSMPAPNAGTRARAKGGGAGTTGGVRGAAGTGTSVIIPVDLPIAPEVEEKLEALQEPDFLEPPESLAATHCGQVFRVDDVSTFEALASGPNHATAARVFDRQGRLLVSEEQTMDYASWHRRLQLDYDDAGRVIRVRESLGKTIGAKLGTVVDLVYAPDGALVAEMFTTRVGPFPLGVSPDGYLIPLGFCERMEFDADTQLVRTSWGCNSEAMRSFEYDAQGRLVQATGSMGAVRGFATRFAESPSWTIRWDYDANDRIVIVWNEMDLRTEQPVEVEQRLVHRLDAWGRTVVSEFDYGNDGTFDERIDYTYDDDSASTWSRMAYDAGADGLLEVVEEHRDEASSRVIEFRHMAQAGDEERFDRVIGLMGPLSGGFALDIPQSTSEWVLALDDDGRVDGAELTTRTVIPFGTSVVTARSTQQYTYGAAGQVEHVAVTAEADDADWFGLGQRGVSCSLEPVCAGDEALALPTDPTLIACQTEVGFEHAPRTPLAQRAYVPPPFEHVPGMRLRHAHALSFDPTPPTVRELVGY